MALITDTSIYTAISATELHSADVHNRPHNDMITMLQDINKHHSRALVHDGDLIVTGKLTVIGNTWASSGIEVTKIKDNNITLNYNGDPANAEGAGFTIAGSTTNYDMGIRYRSADYSKWEVFTATSTGALSIYEGDMSVLQSAPGVSGMDAVTQGQLSTLPAPTTSAPIAITAISQSYDIPSGTYLFNIDKEGTFAVNQWTANTIPPTWFADKVAGTGTQNACFVTGSTSAAQIEYNGSTWVVGASSVSLRKYAVATGVKNSAIEFGGTTDGSTPLTTNEVYDGNSWSTTFLSLTTARFNHAGFGTRYDSIAVGGQYAAADASALSNIERWNGYTWVNLGNLGVARSRLGATGKPNSGLVIGGKDDSSNIETTVFSFNGIMPSWSIVSNLNVERYNASCFGTYNATTVAGGTTSGGVVATIERWDGLSWSTETALPSTKNGGSAIGASNMGLVSDGTTDNAVYKYFGYGLQYNISIFNTVTKDESISPSQVLVSNYPFSITVDYLFDTNSGATQEDKHDNSELFREDWRDGTWSSTGVRNFARGYGAGAGIQNNAFTCGGTSGSVNYPASIETELFNGSTWAQDANINVARCLHAAAGSVGAGLIFGGSSAVGAPDYKASTEFYRNGQWVTVGGGDLNTGRAKHQGFGIYNNAICAGGRVSSGNILTTEIFNGTSWAYTGTLLTTTQSWGGTGSVYAGLISGYTGASQAMKFNGTTWSMAPLPSSNAGVYPVLNGTLNNAMKISGSSYSTMSEKFNGNSWMIAGSLSTGRQAATGAGSQMSGLIAGGEVSNYVMTTSTEKYNSEINTLYSTQTLLTTKIG